MGIEIIADDQKNVPFVPLFLSALRRLFGSNFFTLLAPTKRLSLNNEIFPNRPLGSRWRKFLRRRLSEQSLGVLVLGIFGQVIPLVGIGLQIVELFPIVSVGNVTPVLVDDGILTGSHVRQVNIPVLGNLRFLQGRCQ